MKRIYRIGLIGTRHVAVEEAETGDLACWKAGWDPAWCTVTDITDEVIELKESGDIEIVEIKGEKDGKTKTVQDAREVARGKT